MNIIFEDGFEGEFYDYNGVGELTVPVGWFPGWSRSLTRPEFDEKYQTPEVRTGDRAASFGHRHTTYDGVLWTKVQVGVGKKVHLSAWCMGVSHEDGDPVPKGLGMQVGIDPTGGIDFLRPAVVWGDWVALREGEHEERKWYKVTVEAVSEAGEVTIHLRGKADHAVDINATHWDDVVVEVEDGGAQPPPPPPSNGKLQDYIDTLQADLDALQNYVNQNSINALPV